MARAFHVENTLPHPPETVWARLTDWAAAGDWMPGVERLTAEGEGEGTTLTFHARGRTRTASVVDWEPPRRVTVRSSQGAVTADYTYRVEPTNGGSRVSLEADCTATGLLSWFGPLLRMAMRLADQSQLQALERVLATSATEDR